MPKNWIKCTPTGASGQTMYINLDQVATLTLERGLTRLVFFDGEKMSVNESPESLLAQAKSDPA